MNDLIAYHNDSQRQERVIEKLSRITPEDDAFLLQKAVATIEQYTQTTEIEIDFLDMVNRFIKVHMKSHQTSLQSFSTTLMGLSTAASAIVNYKERHEFNKQASAYLSECIDELSQNGKPGI